MQFHTTGIVLAALTVAFAASAQSTQAVEWKVSEGGNGHWYQAVRSPSPKTWLGANADATQHGALLACITSAQENFWIAAHLNLAEPEPVCGWYLGGYQDPSAQDFSEPSGGWRWVSGEAWSYEGWLNSANYGAPIPGGGRPNNYGGDERYLRMAELPWAPWWDDTGTVTSQIVYGAIFEWSADCNSDGVVDYGQILRGELIDLNANGVPDICETSVSSVIPPSVPSQGGSIITIRGNGFQANPTVQIGGVPATNVVRVSLTEITATSPALLPGMASVQVNDFTLQDGIYIRPECGSDLDQNGSVDAGDIAIILLDFGPCYQAPLAAPAPEVPPLLDAQALPDAPRHR